MDQNDSKTVSLRRRFSEWFASPLGQYVLTTEQEQLEKILPNLFGYHILQYGYPAAANYLSSSKIIDKTILFLDDSEINYCLHGLCAIVTHAEDLPVAANCIDVAVLPHILEYAKDVHKVLREMERVLIGDGHLVIIGINPLSLWGLWYFFLRWRRKMPWTGRLITMHRIKDWLSLLDFDIKKTNCFLFAPPFGNVNLLKKCLLLEQLGRRFWSIFGGLYVIVAQKRIVPLKPLKIQWQKSGVINSNIVESTTR